MSTSSPAYVEPQFTSYDGQISNLDRCNRCGGLRSSHGADWTCPATPRPIASAIPLAAGGALTLASLLWIMASRDAAAHSSLAMAALLTGITLIVMGLVMLRGLRK